MFGGQFIDYVIEPNDPLDSQLIASSKYHITGYSK